MKLLRTLQAVLTAHNHYWGVPHTDNNGRLIQTCYGCNASRKVNVSNIGKGASYRAPGSYPSSAQPRA